MGTCTSAPAQSWVGGGSKTMQPHPTCLFEQQPTLLPTGSRENYLTKAKRAPNSNARETILARAHQHWSIGMRACMPMCI